MIIVYEILLLCGALVSWPVFLLNRRGRVGLLERYGVWRLAPEVRENHAAVIWMHAASLGEVNGIASIAEQLRSSCAKSLIIITCTSISGVMRAKKLGYLSFLAPFDARFFYRLAFKNLKLTALIVSETEIWPAMLNFAQERKLPVFWVNACIRSKNIKFYKLLNRFLPKLYAVISLVAAGSEKGRQSFVDIGIESARVKQLGNAKFDLSPSIDSPEKANTLADSLFVKQQPLLILGSLRPGEEQLCFEAIKILQEKGLVFNTLVAPRHPEKFDFFAEQLSKFALKYARRSLRQPALENILLLDTLGELEACYSVAKVALIGGTIMPFGGHTPAEALSYGVPTICGPHCEVIEEIIDEMLQVGAAKQVRTMQDFSLVLEQLLNDSQVYSSAQVATKLVHARHTGAARRVFNEINNVLASDK